MAGRTRRREPRSWVALGTGLLPLSSWKSSASGFGEKAREPAEPGVNGVSLLPWAMAWHSMTKPSSA